MTTSKYHYLLFVFFLFCYSTTLCGQIKRTGTLEWAMEERFGDFNNDNLPDIPNTYAYVNANNGKNKVAFTFKYTPPSKAELGVSDDINNYLQTRWYLNNSLHSSEASPPTPVESKTMLLKEEFTYQVQAVFTYQSASREIIYTSNAITARPEDILIVALGDSYGSGEGNPGASNPGTPRWADPNLSHWPGASYHTGADGGRVPNTIEFDHQLAHRSATAWSAIAAFELERSDPHTSVTYINLASGGAVTANLIDAHQQKDNDPHTTGTHPYYQIDEARRLVGNRTIDVLAMSIGGNDVGFASAILAYLLRQVVGLFSSDEDEFEKIAEMARTGNWESGVSDINKIKTKILEFGLGKFSELDFEDVIGLDGLEDEYRRLKIKLDNTLPSVKRIYLLEYPDITAGCSEMMQYNTSGLNLSINAEEITHARENIFKPLNGLIRETCGLYGWTCLPPGTSPASSQFGWANKGECMASAEPGAFIGYYHHYKNSPPNLSIANVSYSTSIAESEQRQGNMLGAAHPNSFGQYAIARSMLQHLRPLQSTVDLACNPDSYGPSELYNPYLDPSHPFHKKILSRYISASAWIHTPAGCDQQLIKDKKYLWEAGKEIILEPGFDSGQNKKFEALIDKRLK